MVAAAYVLLNFRRLLNPDKRAQENVEQWAGMTCRAEPTDMRVGQRNELRIDATARSMLGGTHIAADIAVPVNPATLTHRAPKQQPKIESAAQPKMQLS